MVDHCTAHGCGTVELIEDEPWGPLLPVAQSEIIWLRCNPDGACRTLFGLDVARGI